MDLDDIIELGFIEPLTPNSQKLKELMSLINSEVIWQKKVEYIQMIVNDFLRITDVEDLFKHLLPAASNIVKEIFDRNCAIISKTDQDEIISETVISLTSYLQVVTNLLNSLNGILDFIGQQNVIELNQVQSIPLNMCVIINYSFDHCKKSQDRYKQYFMQLDVILQKMFNVTEELYVKLLKFLQQQFKFDMVVADEKYLLIHVLDSLCLMGETLCDLNLKYMSDTWKIYICLCQRYANLIGKEFNCGRLLTIISQLICKKLCNIDQDNLQDLRILNFFIKIVAKLCEIFWNRCTSSVALLKFFINIYRYSEPYQKLMGIPQETIRLIDEYLFKWCRPIISKFMTESRVFLESNISVHIATNARGYLLFLDEVLSLSYDESIVIPTLLAGLFTCLLSEGNILFLKYETSNGLTFYDSLLINFTAKILTLDNNGFQKIEEILLHHFFVENLWTFYFSMDLFVSLSRHIPPTLTYEILMNLIENDQENILVNKFTQRQAFIQYGLILKAIFVQLPNTFKIRVLEKYEPLKYLHLWSYLKYETLPEQSRYILDQTCTRICQLSEQVLSGEFSIENLLDLQNCMKSMPTMNKRTIVSQEKLVKSMMKLWKLILENPNFRKTHFFEHFIYELIDFTSKTLHHFNSCNILLVLEKLKILINYSSIMQINCLKILQCLPINQIHQQNQNLITITKQTIEIFQTLLMSNDILVRINALKVFHVILNNEEFDKITEVCLNNDRVHSLLDKSRKAQTKTNLLNDIYKNYDYSMIHVCIPWTTTLFLNQPDNKIQAKPVNHIKRFNTNSNFKCDESKSNEICLPVKKFKVTDGDFEVQDILGRIKLDLKALKKLSIQGKINTTHSKDIFTIISELNQIV